MYQSNGVFYFPINNSSANTSKPGLVCELARISSFRALKLQTLLSPLYTTMSIGFFFNHWKPTSKCSLRRYGVIGHCNGLLCLHCYSRETDRSGVLIWNPSTKEQKRFPMLKCRQGNPESFGFGYHSDSDDYKVVLVLTAVDKPVKVKSLSLKAGSWKTGQCKIPYIFTLDSVVQHVNGCIYWLINDVRRLCRGVASFDLGTARLREEESLGWILSNSNSCYICLELVGESLCLVDSKDQVTLDVWLMKEDEVRQTKSWIKLFTISSTDDNFSKPLNIKEDQIVPVCFIRNGEVVIYSIEKEEYVFYDPNNQSLTKLVELDNPSTDPTSPYVESLVSPGR